MARYRKIDVRVWSDDKFRRLSAPKPNAQSLWFFLLTNRFTTNIPGLYSAGEAALAEELGWPLLGFRKAFREVQQEGMADADWMARVVWVPKAIRYHEPESPNVIKSWRVAFDEIPDCPLKDVAATILRAYTQGLPEGFAKAFQQAFREGSLKVLRQPLPNQKQEQEQEQKQEQKQEQEQDQDQKLSRGVAFATPAAPRQEPPPTVPVWEAYSAAYEARYKVQPVRNAKVNGQLAQLVKRLGAEESPDVAAWYVSHAGALYVRAGHCVDLLLRDAEKLHTEWATGHRITDTRARQEDRTATNVEGWSELLRGNGHVD